MTTIVRQRGVAIITALLIVAIATTVSVSISTRLQLDVRRTGNMIAADQAYLYTLTAEHLSQSILKADLKDNQTDHLGEPWAGEPPIIPVDGGFVTGKLIDLQACFNINSLIDADTETAVARTRLERLLGNLGLDRGYAQTIIDWLDEDLQTMIPDGAEDVHYMNLERPYRTANTAMISVSELRLIKGFEDPEVYDTLLPHVCAFGVNTPININTASAEVLRSLADNLSEADAESIIEKRGESGFSNIGEFTSSNNLDKKITSTESLSVDTEYFMLQTESTIGQVRVITYSILRRTSDGITSVIARSQGVY